MMVVGKALFGGAGAPHISPFRAALLLHGHGEWAFHPDGGHVRVAREAPLQLTSVGGSSASGAGPEPLR